MAHRAHVWMTRWRRLARDREARVDCPEAIFHVTLGRLPLRRFAREQTLSSGISRVSNEASLLRADMRKYASIRRRQKNASVTTKDQSPGDTAQLLFFHTKMIGGRRLRQVSAPAEAAPGNYAIAPLARADWHLSSRSIVPPNIMILPLPAKCLELNPQENVGRFLGDNWLSNRVFKIAPPPTNWSTLRHVFGHWKEDRYAKEAS
jgi:hypothetical protein